MEKRFMYHADLVTKTNPTGGEMFDLSVCPKAGEKGWSDVPVCAKTGTAENPNKHHNKRSHHKKG